MRKRSIALRKGKQYLVFSSKDQLVFKKIYGNEIVYVYLNKSDKEVKIGSFLSDGVYDEIFENKKFEIKNREIELSPHSVKVLRFKI
jgi:hypothetical protein